MEEWVSRQFKMPNRPPKDGSYHLGKSRTVIVHEIVRGNWTWCTAWSPDGDLLAVATENHHLAVIDTKSSTVWRVRHDRRIKGPMRNNTTHSIRCIAWGANYIAIGGTGNAVSILAPNPPYDVLHRITATGFVGSLDWRGDSNVLAIGSRLDAVLLVEIKETEETPSIHGNMQVDSEILQTLDYKHWVNSVKFSPCGTWLAVGEAGGLVAVYKYHDEPRGSVDSKEVARFVRKDSIQSVEWSPDGKWLYAGGEDRKVAVIDTTYWEIVHRENRDRWVQCISASKGGTHVAVGGVSSEISLLDVNNGWESVMGIELKGLVPLSARWHPKDQYLAVTGQDNSILAVETTNARHVKGHHLHSISPILAIEFSPDGRMAIIGNETGVVTIFSLSGTTFITAYELVITLNDRISIEWSLNGLFVVIGAKDSLIIVGKKKNKRQGKKTPPNGSGFSIKKVIRDFGETNSVSIDPLSRYIAVSGLYTRILSVKADFATIIEWNGPHFANAFSPDGNWLAMLGQEKFLTIYDTSEERVDWWRPIFSLKCDFVGRALAWGPLIVGSLLYLAYGGSSNEIFIMEIRAREGTWETVLRIPRDGPINALDWSTEGLLAAAIGNGTVSIVDLAYLQSGVAVNEMDYNWQRQALTCFTEIRRNRGRNSMKSLRWLPAAPGSDRLLAVGGTDGELEILDLTERQRCRGYASR
jgi:WD40 repeat protein